jgi:hypothetical protein
MSTYMYCIYALMPLTDFKEWRRRRMRVGMQEATILDQHGEGIPSEEGLRIVERAAEDDGMPH